MKLAVELSSTVSTYVANLGAPWSNDFVDYALQCLRGVTLFPWETDELVPGEVVNAEHGEFHAPERCVVKGAREVDQQPPCAFSAQLSVDVGAAYRRRRAFK